MRTQLLAAGSVALLAAAGPDQTATPPASAAVAQAPAAGTGRLSDKLVNDPRTAMWTVYGTGQTSEVLPTGGPQNYPATRVTVRNRGAHAWDVGAGSPLTKPIAAGDTVLMAVYLRAPLLRDGVTTTVSYFGVNQGAPPYDMVAQATATVTNQWKLFYASGRASKAYAADAISASIHLASEGHVIDLGPVRVFDLGHDVDPASLPKND